MKSNDTKLVYRTCRHPVSELQPRGFLLGLERPFLTGSPLRLFLSFLQSPWKYLNHKTYVNSGWFLHLLSRIADTFYARSFFIKDQCKSDPLMSGLLDSWDLFWGRERSSVPSTQNLTSIWPSVNISYYFNLDFLIGAHFLINFFSCRIQSCPKFIFWSREREGNFFKCRWERCHSGCRFQVNAIHGVRAAL